MSERSDALEKGGTGIYWFRKALRLHDNVGLLRAVESCAHLIPLYILDLHQLNPQKWGPNRYFFYSGGNISRLGFFLLPSQKSFTDHSSFTREQWMAEDLVDETKIWVVVAFFCNYLQNSYDFYHAHDWISKIMPQKAPLLLTISTIWVSCK